MRFFALSPTQTPAGKPPDAWDGGLVPQWRLTGSALMSPAAVLVKTDRFEVEQIMSCWSNRVLFESNILLPACSIVIASDDAKNMFANASTGGKTRRGWLKLFNISRLERVVDRTHFLLATDKHLRIIVDMSKPVASFWHEAGFYPLFLTFNGLYGPKDLFHRVSLREDDLPSAPAQGGEILMRSLPAIASSFRSLCDGWDGDSPEGWHRRQTLRRLLGAAEGDTAAGLEMALEAAERTALDKLLEHAPAFEG